MTGSNSFWFAKSGGFYNGVATQSLRFDDGSSAYLNRTFSSSNRKTWTWSGWVKRSSLSGATLVLMYTGSGGGVARGGIVFNSSEQLEMQMNPTGNAWKYIKTNALHRDTSAWYHIVAVLDTTQATESNRQKFYVNGTQQTLSSASYPTLNQDYPFNLGTPHYIGSAVGGGSNFDGYLAEANFVDGTALDASYFGETKNGVWIPIKYTGSYGTNGFRLQFNQTGVGTASTSTIGADTSGNTNHFTSSGIVASDCNMPDSPENNFATFNVLSGNSSTTISEGNLRALANNSSNYLESQNSTFGITSGKWYAEFRADDLLNDGADNGTQIGVTTAPYNRGSGNQNGAITGSTRINLDNSGGAYLGVNTSVTQQGSIGTYADGDIIGVALNVDDSEVSFYKNGSAITNAQDISITDVNGVYFFEVQIRKFSSDTSQITANFGQDSTFAGAISAGGNADGNGIGDFKYAPPSGFLALCTANLPEPTIGPNSATQADDYFNTVLYTGNNSTNNITGVGFLPDWVWIKKRSTAGDPKLIDSSRGVGKSIESNTTDVEADESSSFTAFGADGFSLAGTAGAWNENSNNYVAWNWKANGGTTSSNTDGAGTSTVQANTTAGFSIVTYTGSSNETYGHGLDSAPEMIIVKGRNIAHNWAVYHQGVQDGTANGFLELNTTGATQTGSNPRFLNGTTSTSQPTSTVFNVNHYSGSSTNATNNSDTYVAYCFHSVDGYSKFGSYTGNGSTDGAFVYTGHRPALIMLKRTDSADHWNMLDVKRDTFNVMDTRLLANNSTGEQTSSSYYVDFTSNGFKLRTSDSGWNGSGASYIYMSFAQNPFKYANAR